jgi:hypothetical protein
MKLFIEVVDGGGFSAAARKLRVQQSTVSRIISQLETEYNTILLTRTTRKMVLTEAGHILLAESRRMIAEMDDLCLRLRRTREEPKGLLRIGLSTTFGRLFVVPTLAGFKAKYPDITLEVHLEDRLVDFISEGYDVVIRVGDSEDSFVTSRKLAVVRRGMFVAKSLKNKLGPISSPQDLEKYPAVLFEDRMPTSPQWTLSKGRSKQHIPIREATCVNQLDSICDLVQAGLGVAHVPLFLADAAVRGHSVERVLSEWDVVGDIDSTAGVYALFLGGPKVSAKVRVFVDHLVHHLSRLQD